MTDVIIVGAGGFARETAELVRALGGRWRLLGFVDDDPAKQGTVVSGVDVLGPSADVVEHPDAQLVVCVGSPADSTARQRVVERLDLPTERYAVLVHPAATVAASVQLGRGTVVHAGCVMTADIVVGDHVAMMPNVVLTHDDVIGDYVTFGAGVLLAGGVVVGDGAYLGAGVRVREHCKIGSRSLVGMGSVVTGGVPDDEVWVGTPARRLRPSDPSNDGSL